MTGTYDFVIVGGGTAGSVLANRLTADERATVLLIEAGRPDAGDASADPARWNELPLTDLDWAYLSEPQPGLGGRKVYAAAGRGLGGTSNLHHMIHTRGRPADYDAWAGQGATGWAYEDVLPYLRNQPDPVSAADNGNPISRTFLDACAELGYPEVADFNAPGAAFGAGWHHVDIRDGKRRGVRAAYLEPALDRPGLTVRTGALAGRLTFTGTRCTGVEYRAGGRVHTVRAEREVLLCAGAVQTPKVLMLSGIGDPAHLGGFGIEVRSALPGVGRNLHDHPLTAGPVGYLNRPGEDPRGQVIEVALFWGSEPGVAVPDLEIGLAHRAPFGDQFCAGVVKRVETGEPIAPAAQLVDPRLVVARPSLMRPVSRGWVRLAGDDPAAYPRISPNYCGERADLERMTRMVRMARDIYASAAFRDGYGLTELAPGPQVADGPELESWVIENVGAAGHFAGSARIGTDRMAVVDPALRVHGVDGLRVADASVMPALPSTDPHTTVVMIGEKAADLILD